MPTRRPEGSGSSTRPQTLVGAHEIVIVESKLWSPRTRPPLVLRTALLDRLEASTAPIVSLVAPAGYGKTTLLGQWVDRCPARSSWLSLDKQDDDPGVLLGYLVAALERVEPVAPERRRSLLAEAMVDSSWSLRGLAALVSSMRTPFLLVLDHVEAVTSQRSHDLIAGVALNLPEGSRLALASRTEPPIPIARLRAEARVEEIGLGDLAMDEHEARLLLSAAGTTLNSAEVSELVDRTEGWPVGLYLASQAIKADAHGTGLARLPHGGDRMFADYLRAEVISTLAPSTLALLIRTSILDRLSGPLCDAVMGTSGAQDVLGSLEESNMLLIALDREQHWYRCHHLLGELLRSELGRTEPQSVSRLHDRAASWFEANGQPASALDHAQAAGDGDRAALLFGRIAHVVHGAGGAETVSRWLGWFEERGLIERYPHVAVLGALLEAFSGGRAHARLLADAAEAGDLDRPAPDGGRLDSWTAVVEACLCRRGVHRMRDDAARATQQLTVLSPLRGPATVLEGLAALLQGDALAADQLLAAGAELCLLSGNIPGRAVAVAERAVIAIDRGDREAALRLSDEAVTITEEGQVVAYVHATVVYAVAARVATQAGQLQQARCHVASAARLRPRCTAAVPWSAQFLLQLAYAYLALGDGRGARAVLRQVRDILLVTPDLGVVPEQCATLSRTLDRISVGSEGASSLTVAELRLLPLLATHLNYREIGERLHISRNTVKSEAVSLYRKLGASSRSEAIQNAEAIGLLGAVGPDSIPAG